MNEIVKERRERGEREREREKEIEGERESTWTVPMSASGHFARAWSFLAYSLS